MTDPSTWVPVGDRILVRRDEADAVSQGGVHLPEFNRQRPARGTIVAVGPGKVNEQGVRVPLNVRVGQRVAFPLYSVGNYFSSMGLEAIVMLREQEVLCRLEDE